MLHMLMTPTKRGWFSWNWYVYQWINLTIKQYQQTLTPSLHFCIIIFYTLYHSASINTWQNYLNMSALHPENLGKSYFVLSDIYLWNRWIILQDICLKNATLTKYIVAQYRVPWNKHLPSSNTMEYGSTLI